jgi:FtsP/CotA-like multicopper oxidase with cupredoxin domain
MNKLVKLPQPTLIDLSENTDDLVATIKIKNTVHKFATDTKVSGTDPKTNPIFGSSTYVNGKKISSTTFGLPFFRFKRGTRPRVKLINKTGYVSNLHWHGLNTSSDVDGCATETEFGQGTKIGPELDIHFPPIGNNSALLWLHSHSMFDELALIYSGFVGLLDIVDDESKSVTDQFVYGDNRILMLYQDLNLNKDGTLTLDNLMTNGNRSPFGAINGQSCLNWYSGRHSGDHSDKANVPFVNTLFHTSTKNLVKVDLLNATATWRYTYYGVCDKYGKIKSFYLVQSDTGLMNPSLMKMTSLAPASRSAILFNLEDFEDGEAHVFMYNFDLTEVVDSRISHSDISVAPVLIGTVPDLKSSSNPTVYPTPIIDDVKKPRNQQQNPSELKYPLVKKIKQVEQPLENGSIISPQVSGLPYTIKPFLKINWEKTVSETISMMEMPTVIKQIRKVVFGTENYYKLKHLVNFLSREEKDGKEEKEEKKEDSEIQFEYLPGINYLTLLNPKYFYNLPSFSPDVPVRNFSLFVENGENSIPIDDGSSEYINGSNRICEDMWNSDELDLNYALDQYSLATSAGKYYQPNILPTCLFRITDSSAAGYDQSMIVNDKLTVQLFTSPITYGDTKAVEQDMVASVTITLPPTPNGELMNIDEWVELINDSFYNTQITLPDGRGKKKKIRLSSILSLNWSFYPFKVSTMTEKIWFFKSLLMNLTNSSSYYVQLLGKWQLLQMLGKSMTGGALASDSNSNIRGMPMATLSTSSTSTATSVQLIYPMYATNDPNVQITLTSMDQEAKLIIAPETTFRGNVDSFSNDNLRNFSVQLDSSEQWIYHNGDTTDSHPFHFHLTSGYVDVSNPNNSPGLVSAKRDYVSYLYSRENFGVPPQQSISFNLKFINYSGQDSVFKPKIRGLGNCIHCHFLVHVTENSMMIQYYVYKGDRSKLFGKV